MDLTNAAAPSSKNQHVRRRPLTVSFKADARNGAAPGDISSLRHLLVCAVAMFLASWVSITRGLAQPTVAAGWDLLVTEPTTQFTLPGTTNPINFIGVPLGNFNFGSGFVSVGDNTDTIVHRLDPASPITNPVVTIPTELVALQLQSTTLVDGTNFYYITLQSRRSANERAGKLGIPNPLDDGPKSTGSLTYHFEEQTFDSTFSVFFDVRKGALDGEIMFSDELSLGSTGNPWSTSPPNTDTVIITNVNYTPQGNFFFTHTVDEQEPAGHHDVLPATWKHLILQTIIVTIVDVDLVVDGVLGVGEITVQRSGGGPGPLAVNLQVSGAINGFDYITSLSSVTTLVFQYGVTNIPVFFYDANLTSVSTNKNLNFELRSGPSYELGATNTATITLSNTNLAIYQSNNLLGIKFTAAPETILQESTSLSSRGAWIDISTNSSLNPLFNILVTNSTPAAAFFRVKPRP